MRARFRLRLIAALAALAIVAPLLVDPAASAPPNQNPDLDVENWATGIVSPWDVAFLPNGEALIPEKTSGIVHRRQTNGTITEIEMDQSDFTAPGEGGLMGLVVDPDFDQNRRFYTCQNSTQSDVRVIRWRLNNARTAATRQQVLVDDIVMTSGRHSGCRLRFGYEGFLWISTGDAASTSAPQSLNSLGGKVLRVDPADGDGHPDNPFFTTAGADRSKIYSYGHRNPQGLDRRPCTDQMWSGEHGPSWDDEVNLLQAGGNYGWNPASGYNEGANRQNMTDTSLPGPQVQPKWESGSGTIALSGIGWIRGADWGAWDGELAGATLKNRELWIFEFSNNDNLLDTDLPAELRNGARLRTAVMGPDGSLYVAGSSSGTVLRVTPTVGPAPGSQDLDGDGFDDLIVGAPREDVGTLADAGGFSVLFGGAGGIDPAANGDQLRSQRSVRNASAEAGDGFGSSIAYGDIDGDGTADVVVGAPDEAVGRAAGSGAITVICGRTNGVQERSSQTFSQRGRVAGAAEPGDRFGAAVAMGDFDRDGHDDVVAGAPDEGVSGRSSAGAVTVLYGTPSGLTTENSRAFSQAGAVGGALEPGDRFGAALAVGDFDGDGFDDLAVGAPGETVGGNEGAGAVSIIFGGDDGLRSSGSQYFSQSNVPGDNGAGDNFGKTLAAGDFNGDGTDDLAIGAPTEDLGPDTESGAVVVLFGGDDGLTTAGAQVETQTGPVPGSNEDGDNFGSALAAGDFDGDGDDDLAIGSAGENNGRGRVVTFDGGGSGLTYDNRFSAAGPIPGTAEAGDRLGDALRVGDFNGDGRMDLAIGSPTEDLAGQNNAGAILVLLGSPGGLTGSGARALNQNSAGVDGAAESGDRWGGAL